MKTRCFVVAVALLVSQLVVSSGFAQDDIFVKAPTLAGQDHVPGEIIVKFLPGTPIDVIDGVNARHGTSVLYTSPYAGFKRLRIPQGRTPAHMVEVYKRNPNVEYAELNHVAHAHMEPGDPLYQYQWHLDNGEYGGINMEAAWEVSTGDSTVIVAVVDTGVAYRSHTEEIPIGNSGRTRSVYYNQAPDLADTFFVTGYDFVNDDPYPDDDEGHGTHVTGTIAQSTNNGEGTAGVAFNCSIMPVKVLNSQGSGTYAAIADGIYFAANHGAHVINMSLGGSSTDTTLQTAIVYAYKEGVTIVCSSGNDGSDSVISYPAKYPECIAVGATRYDETVAYYSNCGPELDLTAPGGDLNVDQNGDGYGDGVLQQTFGSDPTDFGYYFYTGTSMAAPHVSGVAALLISSGVATTPEQVRQVLQETAEDHGAAGWDPEYGWGIVDAAAALNCQGMINNPPMVSISSPADNSTFASGDSIGFEGTAMDTEDGELTSSLTWTSDIDDELFSGGTGSCVLSDGTHKITASVTDSGGRTGSDVITITVIGPGATLYVQNIELALYARKAGRNTFTNALATVTVIDTSGAVVEGATVSGMWSGVTSDVDAGVTDASGSVTLSSDSVKDASGTFMFTVNSITKGGWTYEPELNVETDDSITAP